MPPPHGSRHRSPATLFNRDRNHLFRNAGNFGNLALGEEYVDQSLGLIGKQAVLEQLGLALYAFFEWQPGSGFNGIDGGERRK